MRFGRDYRWFNGCCAFPQAYISRVQYEIVKAMGFKIFMDIDMTNSFHQFYFDRQNIAVPSGTDDVGIS